MAVKKIFLAIATAAALLPGCDQGQSRNEPGLPGAGIWSASPVSALKPEAEQIVRSSLADKQWRFRANAIEVVSSSASVSLMPMVVELLRDESVPVRFAAALAVGDIRYRPAAGALKALLKDKDPNVRIAGAYALVRLGRKGHLGLISQALTGTDQTVRANAAMLLGKLGDKRALASLYQVMRSPDSADAVVYQAAESIAMLGDETIYPKLWTRLISKFLDDRIMGVRAMAALGSFEAREAIVTMLDDDEPEVRLVAAERLGAAGDTRGEPEVLEFLNGKADLQADKAVTNRRNVLAALAIGRIGSSSLTKFLPSLLQSRSHQVRLAAAQSVLILQK